MKENDVMTAGELSGVEQEFLEDRIDEHNSARTGRHDAQRIGFLIRDEMGQIVAGLSGWTWAGACQILDLWVHASRRGQGYGRLLVDAAEQEARARGCAVVTLNTYSFQAPDFHQRLGYEVVGQLADFPPGHQDNWLVKRLG